MSGTLVDDARPIPGGPAPQPGRATRRGRVRGWLVGVLVTALVVGLTWVIGFSPVLSVRAVRVVGTHRLDAAAVRTAADIAPGRPLIRIRRGAVERRVETLPEVRSARVTLSYPSTVVITVTERVAAGYRQTGIGSWSFVDATGRSFGRLPQAPAGLPELSPAPAVSGDPPTLAALASVAAAVPGVVRRRLSRLTASGPTSVLLILRNGRTITWGPAERNADKARLLPALLKRPGTVFDISNPDLVYAR